MKQFVLFHALRLIFAAVILVPLSLPLAMSTSQIDTSNYLCLPSGQPQSIEAKAHLIEFLTTIGELEEPDPASSGDHCSNCILIGTALPTKPFRHVSDETYIIKTLFPSYSVTFSYFPTGPPLGGRAPPHFL